MTTSNANAPAQRAMACLEGTILGGWTVRSEWGDEEFFIHS